MSKYQNVKDWLSKYEPIKGWIYFNSVPVVYGATVMNTVPGDRQLRTFIDGSKEVEFVFGIEMVKLYDTGTSDINVDSMEEVDNFANWIEVNKTYPNMGEYTTVTRVEVLSNIPSVLVDTKQGLAKYQFQVKITYKDETEVLR